MKLQFHVYINNYNPHNCGGDSCEYNDEDNDCCYNPYSDQKTQSLFIELSVDQFVKLYSNQEYSPPGQDWVSLLKTPELVDLLCENDIQCNLLEDKTKPMQNVLVGVRCNIDKYHLMCSMFTELKNLLKS